MTLSGLPDKSVKLDRSKIKTPPQGEPLVDEKKKAKEQAKSFAKNMLLSLALADGKISNTELAGLATIDFTVDDVRNILNNTKVNGKNLDLSDDDKQKLTDDLMTRIEAYRQLNQEREGQEPQFGF